MNQEEFARRVTAMQNRMYRVACAYLRGEHDRLDAVSQAILRAWEKHGGLRQPQYFDTWLIRILIRECIAIQRRQARVIPMDRTPSKLLALTRRSSFSTQIELLNSLAFWIKNVAGRACSPT